MTVDLQRNGGHGNQLRLHKQDSISPNSKSRHISIKEDLNNSGEKNSFEDSFERQSSKNHTKYKSPRNSNAMNLIGDSDKFLLNIKSSHEA